MIAQRPAQQLEIDMVRMLPSRADEKRLVIQLGRQILRENRRELRNSIAGRLGKRVVSAARHPFRAQSERLYLFL
ncbi:hypothetical protein WOA01_05875 [Methylocystis sp. IM2]|uniref:hypothetical protein n=1 Tax=Methylocystis sp. IM2 TaxID=3136563 RepID=UPI0030FB18A8